MATKNKAPNMLSYRIAWRQPTAATSMVSGVCASVPPIIAMVTIRPVAKASFCGGNQREASTMQLKKQYAPLMPDKNRKISAIKRLVDKANNDVKTTHDAIAVNTSFRTEKRSSVTPTKKTNSVVAYRYIAEKLPSSEALT